MAHLKQVARNIFQQTLAAVDVGATMPRKLVRTGSQLSITGAEHLAINLAEYERVCVVAAGKASLAMARALASVLAPDFNPTGIIVTPHEIAGSVAASADTTDLGRTTAGTQADLTGFRIIHAGHPVPDTNSVVAARAILDLLHSCNTRTLVFFLLSGGGSALVELPIDAGIEFEDIKQMNRVLVNCGASIEDINTVRKHLSAVKGGRLAAAAPATMKITLGVSDVPAGRESALASGPTLPDPTTIRDARKVIERYSLLPELPANIRARFESPVGLDETPKPGDTAFDRAHFFLLLGTDDLLHHARLAAEAHGCIAVCDNSTDDWRLRDAVDYLLNTVERLAVAHPNHRVALIAGGELSVPVTGDGIGGRNCAFVLESVRKIAQHQPRFSARRITVLSAGTDGKDGSSPAAGAVADSETLARALARGLDPEAYARRSDSYSFFLALDDAVVTGPTGNNLRDLRILIAE